MPLDPAAEEFLKATAGQPGFPPEAETDVRAAHDYLARTREALAAVTVTVKEPVDHVTDMTLPFGRALRVYRNEAGRPAPILLYLHGGGWVVGSLEMNDSLCRRLVSLTGAVVASLDYRLAPEDPYPAALDDCADALAWLRENAATLGGDAGDVSVAGTSAGGNLAAALALLVRDRGLPSLAAQVLLYPVLDARMDTSSYAAYGAGYYLEARQMRWYWHQYVGTDLAGVPGYAAPANVADLRGLAPALIVSAEFDPLRDEAENYAARLAAAGVPIRIVRVDGQIHSFLSFVGVTTAVDAAVADIAEAVQQLWVGAVDSAPAARMGPSDVSPQTKRLLNSRIPPDQDTDKDAADLS
jgi:acetyl esterase/lipase